MVAPAAEERLWQSRHDRGLCVDCGSPEAGETFAIRCLPCVKSRHDAWWRAVGEASLRAAYSQKPYAPSGTAASYVEGVTWRLRSFAIWKSDRRARVLRGFAERLDAIDPEASPLEVFRVARAAAKYAQTVPVRRHWDDYPAPQVVARECFELARRFVRRAA